ncbi:MAG: inosine/xanthosine triphosphatase [Gammaproteobacteria bacterium]|nr:inosine/xanthosine triphosphatase [Gammaproteobacteria bacterium]
MRALKVVVASKNPAKLRAVQDAFALQFPARERELLAVDADSGVADQPASDEETRRGARNRARDARLAVPAADYWVGLEGGVEAIDGTLTAFAWMAVQDAAGRIGEARTVSLPLPPAVKAPVDQGLELGDANDRVFATVNSKQKGGAFGLLTNGLYTREGVYTEALVVALVPLVNPLYTSETN